MGSFAITVIALVLTTILAGVLIFIIRKPFDEVDAALKEVREQVKWAKHKLSREEQLKERVDAGASKAEIIEMKRVWRSQDATHDRRVQKENVIVTPIGLVTYFADQTQLRSIEEKIKTLITGNPAVDLTDYEDFLNATIIRVDSSTSQFDSPLPIGEPYDLNPPPK